MSNFKIADSLHKFGKELAAQNDHFQDFMCQVMSLHSRPEIQAIAKATLRVEQADLCIRVPVEQNTNLVISFNTGGLRFFQEDLSGRSPSMDVEPKDFLIKAGINTLKDLERTWRLINEQLERKAEKLLKQ